MILETLVVGALAVNCYIVGCEATHEAAVIDPGEEAGRIISVLNKKGLKLKYIILTHAHFDHSGAARELQHATGAHVLIDEKDAVMLMNTGAQAAIFGMKANPAPKPDKYLHDGDVIKVGKLEIKVIETPGHTPGSISLFMPAEHVVFTGDTLFWGSIGRTDLPGGDTKTIMHSLKQKLAHLPDNTKVYSGHGDETEIGFEKRENPFLE